MILLVAAESAADGYTQALPDVRVERVGPSAAADRLADAMPGVVVVDRTSAGSDADAVVERVRSGDRPDVPVVVVASEDVSHLPLLRFDAVLGPPVAEETLRDAVERALAVGEYRDAVEDLYERCREYAEGDPVPLEDAADVRAARDRADDLLADLVDRDPGVVVDLLWEPDE